jgi:DNA repair exonuclease SbcCD ATPase subunit
VIKAGKIKLRWFGSCKHINYKFDRVGLNTIQGLNGAGKSTIFNALSWVIYKRTLKPNCTIEPWPHVIDSTYKGTKVSFEFTRDDDKYEIIRCLNYKGKVLGKQGKNRLIFLKNGKQYSEKGKVNIQKEVEKIWGYSFDLFKSAVVFGQKIQRFMEATGPEKKKVFEEAFESAFINKARDIVDKRLLLKIKDYETIRNDVKVCFTNYKGHKETYFQLQQVARVFKKTQGTKIATLEKEARILKNGIENQEVPLRLKNLPKAMRTISRKEALYKSKIDEKAKSEEFDLTLRINRVDQEIDKLNLKIGELKKQRNEIPEKCGECGQSIPAGKRLGYRKKIQQALLGVVSDLEKENKLRDNLLQQHSEKRALITANEFWEKKLNLLKAKKQKYAKIEIEAVQYEERQKSQWALYHNKLEQIAQLKKDKPPIKNLKEAKAKVQHAHEEWVKHKLERKSIFKDLRIDKWLINDPLGNSGLKAFIFDSMMGRVNNYLSSYKTLIGFEVQVKVDLKSSRKDIDITITKNGDEVPFEDLSGGQGQLAGIAVLFSLSDTVHANKPINILLMDEAFESLDRENIPRVEDIIRKKAKNKSIHLITHNDNFNPIGAYKTNLALNNGVTQQTSKYRDN